jgi:hypothetical protein
MVDNLLNCTSSERGKTALDEDGAPCPCQPKVHKFDGTSRVQILQSDRFSPNSVG